MKFKIPQWIWHTVVIVVMVFVFYPTAKDYVSLGQPTGGDLPNSLTYIEHFRKHLTFPPSSWQPFWYSGISTIRSYPWLHFYLMQPLVRVFDVASAVEIYSLGAMFLFFFFSYFLFNFLSKNPLVSLFFVLLLFYTRGTLAALFWSGFINAADTQFFFPLCLLLTLKYLKVGNRKYYVAGAILSGISILAHPMVGIFFVLIPCLTALLFAKEEGFSFWQKFKSLFSFGLIAALISGVNLWPLASLYFATSDIRICLNCTWQLSDILTWFNPLIFYIFAGLLVLGTPFLFLRKEKKDINLFLILLFVSVEFLVIFISVTYNLNIVPLIGGALWPERMVWAISLILSAIAALLVRQILASFEKGFILNLSSSLVVIFAIAFLIYSSPREMFSLLKTHPGVYPYDSVNLLGKYKTKDPSSFVPSWLDTNDFNHRIDNLVYEVYHWWNAVFDIPNTRGYAQFTKGRFNDWNAWLWAAETDNLNIGEEASKNSAKYLLDWFAISYLERNSESFTDRGFYAQYLLGPDMVERSEQVGELYFYQLNSEVTSPIVSATNTPAVLFVGDPKTFDDFTRTLALVNMNSQKIIPVSGPRQLEKLSKINLSDFDAIVLAAYEYDTGQKVWKVLEDYVKEGGKLFVDTGIEVKETDSNVLPDIFPIKETERDSLGSSWQLRASDHPITSGISLDSFSPLLYQTDPWKLSYISNESLIKSGSKVLLSQAGKAILVEGLYGQGKVIWSGINIIYHAKNYNNVEEGRFLENIISYLLGSSNFEPEQEVFRPKPERVIVNSNKAKGVLFKEVYDSGWKARYSINGGRWKETKIYPAGPGFMYIRLPESGDSVKVEFLYRGSFSSWLFFLVGIGTVIWGIWYLAVGNKAVLKSGLLRNIRGRMAHWWDRDEE